MIKSMTGYARTVVQLPAKKLTIEIKSLNSKQMDLSTRLPSYYREKEMEVRRYLSERLVRGKVEMNLFSELEETDSSHTLNRAIVDNYVAQLKAIAPNAPEEEYLKMAVRMPDVFKTGREELDPAEWEQVMAAIAATTDEFDQSRIREGATLAGELEKYVRNIECLLGEVGPFEAERITSIREKLGKDLGELGDKVDNNRFEQEIIFYLEKLDITEEKVRLQSHIGYFLATMKDEENCGRKLGFIAQEMGREINTLGSKSNHAQMQAIVVKMKDELEKIKEQSLNIL